MDSGMGGGRTGNIFAQQQALPPPPPNVFQGMQSAPMDMGGGFGAAPLPAGMMTPTLPGEAGLKDTLVAQVKNFQRQGEQQKELWSMYADMYLNGIRDPARHDAATLHEFC